MALGEGASAVVITLIPTAPTVVAPTASVAVIATAPTPSEA